MRTKKTTSADQVFKMLGFQYKPIEKAMLGFWKQNDLYEEFAPKYKKMTSMQKIKILDLHAAHCGL